MRGKNIFGLVLLFGLAACASLPRSGPTGAQINKSLNDPSQGAEIRIVDLLDSQTPPEQPEPSAATFLGERRAPPPTDLIGPGDVLDINIYEAGVALFAGGGAGTTAGPVAALTTNALGVQLQKLPPSRVDDSGNITIPYVGSLHVQGRSVGDIQMMIQRSLRRLSQNPQVLITIIQPITNSVIVSGEVMRPGRLVLQTNRETLTDVIALAGGYRGNTRDLTLRVVRDTKTVDIRIDDLVRFPALDVRALPGDRFMVISTPRTFSVLGASGRVEQIPFSRSTVSLAEAIATAGGANPNLGDPASIFLFRYEPNGNGADEPVVYHLNMMQARSYLLAQRVMMRDKDVLYFGNAAANQPAKMFQLISQLFTPLVTVTAATQTLKN